MWAGEVGKPGDKDGNSPSSIGCKKESGSSSHEDLLFVSHLVWVKKVWKFLMEIWMERNKGTLLWCSGAFVARSRRGGVAGRRSLKVFTLIETLWAEACR